MSHQLPAEIAEAIEAFRQAERREARLDRLREPLTWSDADQSRKAALAALDAVILKHLGGWRPMSEAPQKGCLLAIVDDEVRVIAYGKTSHVPMYGWCLADQGVEEFDLCEPKGWMPMPSADLGRAALAEEGRGM